MPVSGTITPSESAYSFRWKIPEFLQRIQGTKGTINSPKFSVCDLDNKIGDCSLVIQTPLDGKVGKIGIFLCNESSSVLRMSYCGSLEDENGERIRSFNFAMHEYACSGKSSTWGTPSYISIDELKISSKTLLPRGELTLVLEITKPGPKSSFLCLSSQIEGLFQDTEFSDIKILCQDEVFHSHRILLSARSSVLKAMCSKGFKEGATGEIKLDSMQPEIVKEMLFFIYSGKVKNLEKNAIELLKASDVYQIDNLKEVCGYHLSGKLNEKNCVDYLELGDMYKEQYLKERALDILVKNIKSIMKNEKWVEMEKKNPSLGLEVMKAHVIKTVT